MQKQSVCMFAKAAGNWHSGIVEGQKQWFDLIQCILGPDDICVATLVLRSNTEGVDKPADCGSLTQWESKRSTLDNAHNCGTQGYQSLTRCSLRLLCGKSQWSHHSTKSIWRSPKPSDILEQLHQDIDTCYYHETLRNDRDDTKNDDFLYTCLPDFIANIKSSGTMRDTQKTMTISATSFRGCNRFSPLLTWS